MVINMKTDIVTIGGQIIENSFKFEDKNYISLRYMIYALEGITHEENESLPPEKQKVVWNSVDKFAIFRITDRFTGKTKVIQFSTADFQLNTRPTPREVTINGISAGKIDFVYHNNLNMVGIRELAKLAGLECYLQWYKKDGINYADLRLEDPLYGRGSLKALVDNIVKNNGNIPVSLNGEYYQVIYGTANQGGKVNRYSGYTYSITDAIQWLIQTGGNINFALQIRDTVRLTNCDQQVQAAINGQSAIIQMFMQAKDLLGQCGFANVKTPCFFIGTPEENVKISCYGTDGIMMIYNGVLEELIKSGYTSDNIKETIGGIYFGSETAKVDINTDFDLSIIRKYVETQKKKLLWIPYFTTREELDKIKTLAVYFDKVILQPGLFYTKDKYYLRKEKETGCVGYLEDSEKWNDLLALINKAGAEDKSKDKFGIELEFDMGLITGRGDRDPPMSPVNKLSAFRAYIDKIIPYIGKMPVGVYSGGPNEHGYNNILVNNNLHNNENHSPYEAKAVGFGTGSNYSSLYKGNLIYKINSIIFANKSYKLKQDELNALLSSL